MILYLLKMRWIMKSIQNKKRISDQDIMDFANKWSYNNLS